MKNVQNNNAKKNVAIAKTNEVAKAKKTVVVTTNLNLSKFADKLKDAKNIERKEKETIYKYPSDFTKQDIGNEKGKNFRTACRNKRNRFINNIIAVSARYNIKKDNETAKDLEKVITDFIGFYSENYLKNNFTLESISQSKKDERNADIKTALDIINAVLNA